MQSIWCAHMTFVRVCCFIWLKMNGMSSRMYHSHENSTFDKVVPVPFQMNLQIFFRYVFQSWKVTKCDDTLCAKCTDRHIKACCRVCLVSFWWWNEKIYCNFMQSSVRMCSRTLDGILYWTTGKIKKTFAWI